MKPKWKTTTPPKGTQLLCMVKYETDIYYVVCYNTGTEFINPETKKSVEGVIGWKYIEE